MRFLLRYKYGIFQQKTQRLYAKDITTTTQLLQLVAKKINVKLKDIILRYTEQHQYIKIVAGWDLAHYEIKEGLELQVKVIEKQQEEITSNATNKYLLNLFGSSKELENVNEEEEGEEEEEGAPASKPVFSIRKYLDQELEALLKYVQKGKLTSILKLLKDVPKEVEDIQVLEEIEEQKPKLLNELGEGGWGAVHYAVFCKQLEILKELMKKRVSINKTTADGWTPLQLALNRKHLDELKQLLNHPTIKVNDLTSRGTALHVAAKSSFYEGIELLLQKCADIKILDEKGKSPLDYCEDGGCLRLLQSLQDKRSVRTVSVPMEVPSNLVVLKGTLMKAKAVFMNLKQRYMVLDPYEGTLIRYEDQESCPKKPMEIIPLSTIKNIKILSSSEKTWQMKKEYCYLEIDCQKKLLFATKHIEIMNIWFQGLESAIRFYMEQEKNEIKMKAFVKDQSKTILILDDVSNKITPVGPAAGSFGQEYNKLPEPKKLTEVSKDSISEPKMPVSNISMASNQYGDNKTSFTSEVDRSYRKQGQSMEQDFGSMGDFANMKSSDKIQFSSFTLIKQLGSGAFGKVFLAKLIENGKLYALKALKKRNLLLGNQKKFAVEEVNILKEVNHPYIINLNYAFQTPQYLYLALDYCPGKDLNFHLMFQGTFPQQDTKIYMAELFLAIEHLHLKKILYRDLKPQNVLLDGEGHIRLTDFGLSKSNVQNKAKSFVGTQAYLSPDMLAGGGIDKQADIYGVGCIMYQCLMGMPPFYSQDLATLYQNIKQGVLEFPQTISLPAQDMMKGLLQRNPKKRLGSASMQQIKNHKFFAGLQWQKLQRREIKAPQRMYQDQDQQQQDQLNILPRLKFQDSDYQGDGQKTNRFNNFSFAR